MPHFETMDEKFEGFEIYIVRQASRALQEVQELSNKPKLLAAAKKYLEKEKKEIEDALDLTKNL